MLRYHIIVYSVACWAMLLHLSSCRPTAAPTAAGTSAVGASYFDLQEGAIKAGGVRMIPIETPVGKFNVWTKRFGNNPTKKVLLLHGGPACTHEYWECVESFFPKENIEFYHYDQLGSYYSDQPQDSSLWVTERFVEEVEQVRQALGLGKDNFYLIGHSWGGILAIEYALKYQQHLKGLVITNMVASIPRYEKYNNVLRAQLRPTLLDSLEVFEKKGDYQNPTYVKLVETEFYTKHLCRLPELPDPVQRGIAKHLNYTVYKMMQGPSEFKTSGRLYTWDRWNDLPKITVPTLCVGARYDTMNPAEMEEMSKLVKQGRYHYCPNGSHMDMWDDQQTWFKGIIDFIHAVDNGSFAKQ